MIRSEFWAYSHWRVVETKYMLVIAKMCSDLMAIVSTQCLNTVSQIQYYLFEEIFNENLDKGETTDVLQVQKSVLAGFLSTWQSNSPLRGGKLS